MKKLLLLMMISVMLVGMMLPVGALHSGGSGSVGDPYIITGGEYTNACGTLVSDINSNCASSFIMTSDVTCGASEVLSAGACTPFSDDFTGTFDGQNFTITDLTISSATSRQGLFRSTSGGTIKNVGLVDVSVSSSSYVGGLVGYSGSSSIDNSFASGSVSGSS